MTPAVLPRTPTPRPTLTLPEPSADDDDTGAAADDGDGLYRFTVVDSVAGEPIAGARLAMPVDYQYQEVAVADGGGHISLAIDGELPNRASIEMAGYSTRYLENDEIAAAGDELVIELVRLTTVVVSMESREDDSNSVRLHVQPATGTGVDSHFWSSPISFELEPGPMLVWAEREGRMIAFTEVETVGGQSHEVHLREREPSSFGLHVVDSHGRPVAVNIDVDRGRLPTGKFEEVSTGTWWSTWDEHSVNVPALPGETFAVSLFLAGERLATETVTAGEERTIVIATPVVECTLVSKDGERLPFVGYSFTSETRDTESSIGVGGGSSGGIESYRFPWTDDLVAIELELSAREQRGSIRLTSPHQRCTVVAQPSRDADSGN